MIERWCCWASTSVGASSAAWPPESTTWSIARSATTVLPEPTSPCSNRCIGWPWPSSAAISSPTLRWPSVRANGSRSSNRSRMPPGAPGRGLATVRLDRGSATGEHGLRDEGLVVLEPLLGRQTFWPQLSGRWIQRSAWSTSMRSSAARTDGGSRSGMSATRSRASRDRAPRTARCSRRPRRSRAGSGRASRRRRRSAAAPYILESGLVSCQWLLNHFSRPLNMPTRPRASSPVRQSAVCLALVEVGQREAAVLGLDAHLEAVRRPVGPPVLVGLLDAADHLADERDQVALL